MFEDVAQMEKEIETFRKNVVASSELVEGIVGLTEATRQHKESYSAATAELLKKVDACIAAIKADHESALRTLSTNNDAAITTLQKNMAAEQVSRMEELQQIKTALENLQAAYADRLQQTETAIGEYQIKLGDSVGQIKADHEATLKALSDRVDAAIADLQKKSAEDLAARVAEVEGIKSAIGEYQAETTKKTDEQIQHLVKECERLIAEMKSEIAAQEFAYAEKLQQTETAIREYQAEATKKTDEQIQQLVKECERLIAQMKSEIAVQETAYAEKLQQTEQAIRGYQAEAEKKYNEFVNRLESTNVDQIFKEVQDLKQSIQTKFMILMGGIGVAVIVGVLGIILK